MGEIITQRQDVPEWAYPVSYAGLEQIAKLLFNAPNAKDPNNYWKNGKLDFSGGMKSDMAPPDQPLPGLYNEVEQGSRDYIFNKAESGQPLRLSMDQRLMDLLGRGDPNAVDTMGDLADESRIFNMGGPLSGAARSAGLSAINGETQGAANQALMDAIFGQGARTASKSASSKLGKEQDVARDASFGNFMSPNMGAARSRQLDTIQGNFLYPGSNPFLDSTADAMSRRMGNEEAQRAQRCHRWHCAHSLPIARAGGPRADAGPHVQHTIPSRRVRPLVPMQDLGGCRWGRP